MTNINASGNTVINKEPELVAGAACNKEIKGIESFLFKQIELCLCRIS
ncbi:MAG TPA: hypothetical protein PLU33_08595 [Treponemataceae bacterium]|nr:hypothetical protein [Treponemataceae bacterium]HQL05186.1 hypothetical protein [Treponemataceae bacterium]